MITPCRYADFHLHTTCSDGADLPHRVVERAHAFGFSAIAITDHDTVDGVREAWDSSDRAGIACVAGVELSASFERVDVHVLGLGIDLDNPELKTTLARMRNARAERAQKILDKLRALGLSVSIDLDCGAVGRMHIARAIHEAGYAKTVQHAFDKWLQPNKPAYVANLRLSCSDAIALIHAAGGLAFLAHPGIGGPKRKLRTLLQLPFDGIECFHSKHSPGESEMFVQLARERGLLVTGGSDCHGEAKGRPEMGKVRLPYEYAQEILDRVKTG